MKHSRLFSYKNINSHASPLEHQATPDDFAGSWANPHLHGNLNGWIQYRKIWEREIYNIQHNGT